jgi:hypothetical protein
MHLGAIAPAAAPMNIHIYMYIFVFICTHNYTYRNIRIIVPTVKYTYIHVCLYTYSRCMRIIHIYMYIFSPVHTYYYTYIHSYIQPCSQANIRTHMHVYPCFALCIHNCTHTHAYIPCACTSLHQHLGPSASHAYVIHYPLMRSMRGREMHVVASPSPASCSHPVISPRMRVSPVVQRELDRCMVLANHMPKKTEQETNCVKSRNRKIASGCVHRVQCVRRTWNVLFFHVYRTHCMHAYYTPPVKKNKFQYIQKFIYSYT